MNTRTEPAMMAGTVTAAVIALLVGYGALTDVQATLWNNLLSALAAILAPVVAGW